MLDIPTFAKALLVKSTISDFKAEEGARVKEQLNFLVGPFKSTISSTLG